MEQVLLICGVLSGVGFGCLVVYKWVVMPVNLRLKVYQDLIKIMDGQVTTYEEHKEAQVKLVAAMQAKIDVLEAGYDQGKVLASKAVQAGEIRAAELEKMLIDTEHGLSENIDLLGYEVSDHVVFRQIEEDVMVKLRRFIGEEACWKATPIVFNPENRGKITDEVIVQVTLGHGPSVEHEKGDV